MEKTTKRGRPPRKKEPEAEVLHTTAEAICEIQKNPDTEFEQKLCVRCCGVEKKPQWGDSDDSKGLPI